MQSFPLSAVFPTVERVMKPHRAALHQSIRTLIGAVPLCWIVVLKIGFSESCCVFNDGGVSCTARYDPPRLKNVCQHCLGPASRGDGMTIRALSIGTVVAMLSSIVYSAREYPLPPSPTAFSIDVSSQKPEVSSILLKRLSSVGTMPPGMVALDNLFKKGLCPDL